MGRYVVSILLYLLCSLGIWGCKSESKPDCRQASQACAPGFECAEKESRWNCEEAKESTSQLPPKFQAITIPENEIKAMPTTPSFSGEIGHLKKSQDFGKFVYDHRFKVVLLDVTIPMDEFEGDNESLTLWESCEDLPNGQKPSSSYCGGTLYNVTKTAEAQSDLSCSRGTCKLTGYFAVSDFGGPHQGLMGTTLKAVRTEDVR